MIFSFLYKLIKSNQINFQTSIFFDCKINLKSKFIKNDVNHLNVYKIFLVIYIKTKIQIT